MFQGSFAALVTPFTEENAVDCNALAALIEWHIASGTDGLVLCGVTGESTTLSDEEKLSIFKEGVRIAAGRIPLIAGTGSNDTRHAVELTEAAKECGVDGALVVVPYYNRPTPEGCIRHFAAIAQVGLPLFPYHHPSRTGIKLPVKTLAAIASLPSVVAIKEGSCDLDYAIEFMQLTRTPVFTGDDPLIIPYMASGAVGVISVVANVIPQEWHALTQLLNRDRGTEARALFQRFFPLVRALFSEINPQCVKYALSLMGKCSARMRLPLIEPQESTKLQIAEALAQAISAGV